MGVSFAVGRYLAESMKQKPCFRPEIKSRVFVASASSAALPPMFDGCVRSLPANQAAYPPSVHRR